MMPDKWFANTSIKVILYSFPSVNGGNVVINRFGVIIQFYRADVFAVVDIIQKKNEDIPNVSEDEETASEE